LNSQGRSLAFSYRTKRAIIVHESVSRGEAAKMFDSICAKIGEKRVTRLHPYPESGGHLGTPYWAYTEKISNV